MMTEEVLYYMCQNYNRDLKIAWLIGAFLVGFGVACMIIGLLRK